MNQNPVNPVNPVEEPSCPSFPSVETKPGRPLSRLAGFSARQLEHINAWLDEGVSYREIAELCRTEFQKEVPHMTIARYYHRSAARKLVEDLTDSKEAAREISRYAATGDASLSTTTLELLEQQAFNLALAFHRDAEADDLRTLQTLWTLIHKAKNTAVRERHATVQEQKCALRAQELALKHRHVTPTDGRPSPIHTSAMMTSCDGAPTSETTSPETPAHSDPTSEIKNQKSEIILPSAPNSPASHLPQNIFSSLPPEVIENNRRYARLLLAGKIKFPQPGELPDDTDDPDALPIHTPGAAPSTLPPFSSCGEPGSTNPQNPTSTPHTPSTHTSEGEP